MAEKDGTIWQADVACRLERLLASYKELVALREDGVLRLKVAALQSQGTVGLAAENALFNFACCCHLEREESSDPSSEDRRRRMEHLLREAREIDRRLREIVTEYNSLIPECPQDDASPKFVPLELPELRKADDFSLPDGAIFISYARRNRDVVFPIIDLIREETHCRPWYDIDGIETGSLFADKIMTAIDRCNVFVFFLSVDSLLSDWTRREFTYAVDQGKKICPINIDGSRPSGWFKFMYGEIDVIDYSNADQCEKMFRDLKSWAKGLAVGVNDGGSASNQS